MKASLYSLAMALVLALTWAGCTPKAESDDALLDKIEQATIKYFTEFASATKTCTATS